MGRPERTSVAAPALTPIVLVLLDGLGDRAHAALGARTTNEAASTPNLDAFAARGVSGLVWPLGPGRAPSSELAHWTYFTGSLETFPGRAVLEGRGHGLRFVDGEVAGYAALRAGEVRDDGVVRLGRRAEGRVDDLDARELFAAIDGRLVDGTGFLLEPVAPGEAVLRLRGGANAPVSGAVSDTDSFEDDLHPLLACEALATPVKRTAAAAAVTTASAVNAWTLLTCEMLNAHPVNARRRAEGRDPLRFVTTKWWGVARPTPSFEARTGLRGVIVSASAYQGGIAATLGMRWQRPEPARAGEHGIAERLRRARELLAEGYDFVHCHDKAPDEAGHTKDPKAKLRVIESLDRGLAALDRLRDAIVVVTGDHATPAGGRLLHSGDAVPFLIAGPGVRADPVTGFGEAHQVAGWLGHIRGEDVLPLALDAAGRSRFQGGHAGPVPDSIGVDPRPRPLRLPGPLE